MSSCVAENSMLHIRTIVALAQIQRQAALCYHPKKNKHSLVPNQQEEISHPPFPAIADPFPTTHNKTRSSHGHLVLLALLQPSLLVAASVVGANRGLHLYAGWGDPLHEGLHGLC